MPIFGFRRPATNGRSAPVAAPSAEPPATPRPVSSNGVGHNGAAGIGVTEASVLEALRQVQDPDLHRDVVSLGMIKDLKIAY